MEAPTNSKSGMVEYSIPISKSIFAAPCYFITPFITSTQVPVYE